MYDPEKDELIATSTASIEGIDIDSTYREFKDEGIFPGKGTFHMYHRIDGKLVAVGVVDILD